MEGSMDPASIEFFPNPSEGSFNLRFSTMESTDVQVIIRDVNGAVVYEEALENFSGAYDKVIDLGNEASGTYFVQVVQGDESVIKQMIIQ